MTYGVSEYPPGPYQVERTPTSNHQVGDVVEGEPNYLPFSWPLGRITQVYPGVDGEVRRASVRITSGLFCLCPAVKPIKMPC